MAVTTQSSTLYFDEASEFAGEAVDFGDEVLSDKGKRYVVTDTHGIEIKGAFFVEVQNAGGRTMYVEPKVLGLVIRRCAAECNEEVSVAPGESQFKMFDFTVVGFYPDGYQAFVDHVAAESAVAAEQDAMLKGVLVVSVFSGHHSDLRESPVVGGCENNDH